MDKLMETPQEMVAKFKGKALNYNVVIRQVKNENVTESGLDMTGVIDKNEKIKKGIVISIGSECPKENIKFFGFRIPFLKKNTVNPKDEVLFDSYKTSPLTIDAVEYVIVHFADLIHVL